MAGAAALYAISTQPPFAQVQFLSSTRRVVDKTMLVLYKTAAGTGRAAWYSSTTLFLMVAPVLFIMDTSEPVDPKAAAGAAIPPPISAS